MNIPRRPYRMYCNTTTFEHCAVSSEIDGPGSPTREGAMLKLADVLENVAARLRADAAALLAGRGESGGSGV